jgi:SAM-dependent methyltransferase
VHLRFATADFRRLEDVLQDRFDVVCCLDNAIAHLQEDHELRAACASMAGRLHPGGLLVLSIRDYDRIFAPSAAAATDPGLPGLAPGGEQSLPSGTLPRVFDGPDGRRIAFQVWDWSEDRRSYAVHQYFVHGDAQAPRTTHYASRFRALRRAEMDAALLAAGLRDVRWLMPEHSGFYQPLVLARAP